MRNRVIYGLMAALLFPFSLSADDWPVFKGNIYYTGNNDEITVNNGNLKWLYEASNVTLNPVVSDGKIYFLDIAKNVYRLDVRRVALNGKLIFCSLVAV